MSDSVRPPGARPDGGSASGDTLERQDLLELLVEMLDEVGSTDGEVPPLELLDRLVVRARDVVQGADSVSISMVRRGSTKTLAASDSFARQVDAIQYDVGSGPCVDAAVEDHVYVTEDVARDGRWPEFGARAHRATGVTSVLALRLRLLDESRATAALNIYAREAGAFDDEAVRQGVLFATQCALLVTAHLSHDTAANLSRALESNREIGIATGVVMTTLKVDRDRAFGVLRMASQDSNRKLADIASEVAHTGVVPLGRLRGSHRP